jgi:argininosuccinate lyase
MAELTGTLAFNPERMRAAAAESFAVATEIADYLVEKGVSFRDAHRVTGQLVRKCIDEKKMLDELELEELTTFAKQFDEGYFEVVRLEAAIERKASYGGTASAMVKAQLGGAKSRLDGMQQTISELES